MLWRTVGCLLGIQWKNGDKPVVEQVLGRVDGGFNYLLEDKFGCRGAGRLCTSIYEMDDV